MEATSSRSRTVVVVSCGGVWNCVTGVAYVSCMCGGGCVSCELLTKYELDFRGQTLFKSRPDRSRDKERLLSTNREKLEYKIVIF
jgi:hypothetical protein